MAAVTPTIADGSSPTAEEMNGAFLSTQGHSVVGFKHVTLPFLETNAIDSTDTYTPLGTETNYQAMQIVRAAWEPATSADESAVTITAATATAAAFVTFTGSTDNIEGYLHLWITN